MNEEFTRSQCEEFLKVTKLAKWHCRPELGTTTSQFSTSWGLLNPWRSIFFGHGYRFSRVHFHIDPGIGVARGLPTIALWMPASWRWFNLLNFQAFKMALFSSCCCLNLCVLGRHRLPDKLNLCFVIDVWFLTSFWQTTRKADDPQFSYSEQVCRVRWPCFLICIFSNAEDTICIILRIFNICRIIILVDVRALDTRAKYIDINFFSLRIHFCSVQFKVESCRPLSVILDNRCPFKNLTFSPVLLAP